MDNRKIRDNKNVDMSKDIFLKVMNFKSAERTLKWEMGYWVGAAKRWYNEGLNKNKGYKNDLKYGDSLLGSGNPFTGTRTTGLMPNNEYDIANYFNLDKGWGTAPYNLWMFPLFEEKIIFEDQDFIEYFGSDGVRRKEFKDKKSMPMFMEFPVKNRYDWDKLKEERFNLNNLDKRFIGDEDSFVNEAKNRTKPLGALGYPVGFFGSLRWLIGEKNLFLLYYDDPDLIKEILKHLCDLWVLITKRLTSKIKFDFAVFWEDMSGKQGSMISPQTFKEFMAPNYRRLIDYLKSNGTKIFALDTDGYVEKLIPLFLEVGINTLFPFEQQANNDLLKYREEFPELRMLGGIDKNKITIDKKSIDQELQYMSILVSKGGYIPFLDHHVPPNISWQNYKYYRNKLNNIIDTTKVLRN